MRTVRVLIRGLLVLVCLAACFLFLTLSSTPAMDPRLTYGGF